MLLCFMPVFLIFAQQTIASRIPVVVSDKQCCKHLQHCATLFVLLLG